MRLLVTGASGLIGQALLPRLEQMGHQVLRLIRSGVSDPTRERLWNPAEKILNPVDLEGIDGVIHLAGASLNNKWTPEYKQEILNSRVQSTRFLCETMAKLTSAPRVLISASAIGYYGHRREELLKEDSPPGRGFLAEVAELWEKATRPAQEAGIRVVLLRTGIVLSTQGGALKQMLTPFKLGLGGQIGSGQQHWSWIDITDEISIIEAALIDDHYSGPINAVAPNPVRNVEFTHTLGRLLNRPTFMNLPSKPLRWWFGEMADELLLASTLVEPTKLKNLRFQFKFPTLEKSLQHLLEQKV